MISFFKNNFGDKFTNEGALPKIEFCFSAEAGIVFEAEAGCKITGAKNMIVRGYESNFGMFRRGVFFNETGGKMEVFGSSGRFVL